MSSRCHRPGALVLMGRHRPQRQVRRDAPHRLHFRRGQGEARVPAVRLGREVGLAESGS